MTEQSNVQTQNNSIPVPPPLLLLSENTSLMGGLPPPPPLDLVLSGVGLGNSGIQGGFTGMTS